MIPNIERGHSFKGVTAYLMHDKKPAGAGAQTAARVGFTHVLNFIGDEARDLVEAAKVMALTVRDADILKAAAGIKPGGRKAEKGPVWHTSLAWHPSEQVSEAEMMEAVKSCLSAVGLGLDLGHQTYVVQHTDEPQPHVHIVVNLVHPITGKRLNPYRDQPKAQEWGNRYEQQRGKVFCTDRAAKYGDRTPEQAAFNAAAQDRPPLPVAPRPANDRGPAKRPPRTQRPEWQARKPAKGSREEKQAADVIKAAMAAQYAEQKAAGEAAVQRRKAEIARLHKDRKAERSAIYERYATALDAVWKPEKGSKDTGRDWTQAQYVGHRLQLREAAFRKNERTLMGRLKNAATLLPKAPLFAVLWVAVNGAERRKLFNLSQVIFRRQNLAPEFIDRRVILEPKKVKAERLKAARADEIIKHDRDTARLLDELKARHVIERQAEKTARAERAAASKEIWRAHNERFVAPEKAVDRFGRSRDRQPREPRHNALEGAVETQEADNVPEVMPAFAPAPTQEAPATPSLTRIWTEAERTTFAEIEARRQAEVQAERDGHDQGGRERSGP